MKKFLGILVLIFALLVGDALLKDWSEDRMLELVRSAAPRNSTGSSVRIEEYAISVGGRKILAAPFLPRVLLTGGPRQVVVTYSGGEVGGVPVDSIRATFHGLRVDRADLISGKFRLRDLDKGHVVARSSLRGLQSVLAGQEIRITAGGRVSFVVRGQEIPTTVSVSADNHLVFTGNGQEFARLRLQSPYVPCTPKVVVESQGLALSCEFAELPAYLKRVRV